MMEILVKMDTYGLTQHSTQKNILNAEVKAYYNQLKNPVLLIAYGVTQFAYF
jgi:hypothetical protein